MHFGKGGGWEQTTRRLARTESACLKLVITLSARQVAYSKEREELKIKGVGYGCCC